MTGVITAFVVLLLGLGGSLWGLKTQLQNNATLEADIKQFEQTIKDKDDEYQKLEQEKEKSETIIVATEKEKRLISVELNQARRTIEYIRTSGVEGADCLNQSMPAELVDCLREGSCYTADRN